MVQGYFLGTDPAGTLDLGKAAQGLLIRDSASQNTLGGTAAGRSFRRNRVTRIVLRHRWERSPRL